MKTWLKNLGKRIGKTHEVEVDSVVVKRSEIAKPDRDAYFTSKEGKLLWGDDVLSTMAPIQPDFLRSSARDAVQRWLNLVPEHPPLDQDIKELARGLADVILQIAREALLARGLYISDKGKFAEKFNNVFADFQFKSVVKEASDLRKNWARLKNDEEKLKLWISKAVTFLKAFKEYIKLHPL